jgi:MarR family transcriptional regulator for hemolysin
MPMQRVIGPSADQVALVVDCIGRRLTLAARAARHALEAHLATAGMTYAGYVVLMTLRRLEPMIQRELAESLDIEGPTLTRQLERLERQRLIVRRRGEADRRVTLVELSPAGRDMVERLQPVVAAAAQEVAADLDPDEVRLLGSLLDRLTGALQTRLGAAPDCAGE